MTGSWTSLVSATWAALGSRGVTVGRSKVEARRWITGVFGRVISDSGGRKTSPSSVEMMLGKSGWILGGSEFLGEGELVIATLTKLVMTASTTVSCSGGEVSGDGTNGYFSSFYPFLYSHTSRVALVVFFYKFCGVEVLFWFPAVVSIGVSLPLD